jgi:purine catabolism regulator
MKSSSVPITLGELLRLALPKRTEFIGQPDQLAHVVKWAVVVNWPISAATLDVNADDFVLSAETPQANVAALLETVTPLNIAAVGLIGPLSGEALDVARASNLPIFILPAGASLRSAHQSALTLITNRQAQMSQRAVQVRQQLETLVAEGAGLEAIVWAMADLTRKGVIVQDKRLIPIAASSHPTLGSVWNDVLGSLSDPDRLPRGWSDRKLAASQRHIEHQALPGGLSRLITPIVVKNVARGYLSLIGVAEELDALDQLVAEQGAEACALEMAKAKAVSQVTKQLRGEFVDAMLAGRVSAKETEQWAKQLGHDVAAPHVAIVFAWDGSHQPSLRRLETVINGEINLGRVPALLRVEQSANRAGLFVALEPSSSIKPARDVATAIYSRATAEHPKATLRCGMGRVANNLGEWRTSYREAGQALDMATQLDERQPIYFGDLSVYRLLFKMAEHPDLISFCNETLGALTKYDTEQHSNLLQTLEAFFEHHGNLSQTAEALYIHRNTLQYRLERIAEIAAIDLENPETRLALQLAIKAYRLLNVKSS